MPSEYTKAERESHVKAWKKSKLSQKAYCQIKGLTWSTFKNWCKPARQTQNDYPLVPIHVTTSAHRDQTTLTLQSPHGWQIILNGAIDDQQLRQVVQLLGEAAC